MFHVSETMKKMPRQYLANGAFSESHKCYNTLLLTAMLQSLWSECQTRHGGQFCVRVFLAFGYRFYRFSSPNRPAAQPAEAQFVINQATHQEDDSRGSRQIRRRPRLPRPDTVAALVA